MIPKSDAKAITEMVHAAEIEKMEKQIDAAIRQRDSERVAINAFGWSLTLCKILQKKYEAGGWKVEIIDNQYDGKTIVLS